MTTKKRVAKKDVQADRIQANVKLAVGVVAIAVAGYFIISFVQSYMSAGAFVLPSGTTATGAKTNATVCSTCAETGRLAPKCAGSCPDGQDCKLVIDTGLCTCVSK